MNAERKVIPKLEARCSLGKADFADENYLLVQIRLHVLESLRSSRRLLLLISGEPRIQLRRASRLVLRLVVGVGLIGILVWLIRALRILIWYAIRVWLILLR